MCVCADNCPVDADCSFGADAHSLHDLYQRSGEPLFHFPPSVTLFSPSFCSPPPYSLPTQLDLIVQFALTKTGHIPTCSPLMNCAVLVSMAFIPIFPVTLLRVLTPMQITSTFGYMCVHYITLDAEGRVHIITDRAGTLDKQSPLDKSESGTGERLQYY